MAEKATAVAESPKPQHYESSKAFLDSISTIGKTKPPTAVVAGATLDPLRSFERDRPQNRSDLAQWATYTEEDRAKRLVDFAKDDELSLPERRRIFSYIVWLEAEPGRKGSRQIAEAALAQLFGRVPATK